MLGRDGARPPLLIQSKDGSSIPGLPFRCGNGAAGFVYEPVTARGNLDLLFPLGSIARFGQSTSHLVVEGNQIECVPCIQKALSRRSSRISSSNTSPPRRGSRRPRSGARARADELARLLIAPNLADAFDLIDHSLARAASPAALFTGLFEPTARKLGDLWSEDACSEFEVAIGLCHLQTAMRRISFDLLSAPLTRSQPRTRAGDLAARRAAFVLRRAAFRTAAPGRLESRSANSRIPTRRCAIWSPMAGSTRINLSLSPALRREHWLPRSAETIRKVRRASRNPALAVVTSGRVFAERADACALVGADAATVSSVQIERCLMRSLLNRTARPAANFAWI